MSALTTKAELVAHLMQVDDFPAFLAERLERGDTYRDVEFEIRTRIGRDLVSAQALHQWAQKWGLDSVRARTAS